MTFLADDHPTLARPVGLVVLPHGLAREAGKDLIMDEQATRKFVARVLADAERAFGPDANRGVVVRYAGEAILDRWMSDPTLTTRDAKRTLVRLRQEIQRRSGPVGERLAA